MNLRVIASSPAGQSSNIAADVAALDAVERQLLRDLDSSLPPAKRSGVLAALGRFRKQRYVAQRRISDLNRAIAYYRSGWQTNVDRDCHGDNMVTLQSLGRRLDQSVDEEPGDEEIATTVLGPAADGDAARAIAIEAEVRLATGDSHGALKAIARLVGMQCPPARIRRLRSELFEVWGLDDADPLLLALDDQLARAGELVASCLVPSGTGGLNAVTRFEYVLASAQAFGCWSLVDGLVAAQSVGTVTDRGGHHRVGTAFLIAGNLICDFLGPDLILATTADVISENFGGVVGAADAQVRFDFARDADGGPLICDGLTEFWSSPMCRCGVTLLRFDDGVPCLFGELEAAERAQTFGSESGLGPNRVPDEFQLGSGPAFDHNWKLVGVQKPDLGIGEAVDNGQRGIAEAGTGQTGGGEIVALDQIRAQFAPSDCSAPLRSTDESADGLADELVGPLVRVGCGGISSR